MNPIAPANADAAATQRIELNHPWQVWPVAPTAETPLDSTPDSVPADAHAIPPARHLQPVLYPDNPFWGDHLRAVNQQDWIYRQTFDIPADWPTNGGPRVRLHFGGVDYYASVWLNGQYLGQHEGHFAPFHFDVTEAVRPGENTLLVRVSAPWDPPTPSGAYPIDHVLRGMVKGLYEHGEGLIPPNVNPLGIWRPVWVTLDEGIEIERVRIRAGADGRAEVLVIASNARHEAWQGTLELAIRAENHDGPGCTQYIGLTLAPGQREGLHRLSIPEPRLWWPWDHGNPHLYRLSATLRGLDGRTIHAHEEVFGLRSVELVRTRERFIYRINGRDVFLRGTSYMPGLYLSECTAAGIAADIEAARRANLNLLRVHVHVSPPEVYDLCDRAGIMVWQDFELNWTHTPTPDFERRALALQREMIDLLGNHASVITWACHNEPTMVFTRRENLEFHPDPALYAAAREQDPTRPVFICSGQMDQDWQRAGDTHCYYGALWSAHYTDVHRFPIKLGTEFGFEAPAAESTLRAHPEVWERLGHLEGQIEALWQYQAELTRYYIEHFRRLRARSCGGYVHFWLADLVAQVGCGVLDSRRVPKGGYEALRIASQPLQVALEYDRRCPLALWIFNDTLADYPEASLEWEVRDESGAIRQQGRRFCAIAPNQSQQVARVRWQADECAHVVLTLRGADGAVLAQNQYDHPFRPTPRPKGYPWKFDPVLACKVFDRPVALSLAEVGAPPISKILPLKWRENIAEWALRQQLPLPVVQFIARILRGKG